MNKLSMKLVCVPRMDNKTSGNQRMWDTNFPSLFRDSKYAPWLPIAV